MHNTIFQHLCAFACEARTITSHNFYRFFGVCCSASHGLRLWTNECKGVRYHDPRTWPRHLSEADIRRLLSDNLICTGGVSPNYKTFCELLRMGDTASLSVLLEHHVMPPRSPHVDVDQYLALWLGNHNSGAAMVLQERALQLGSLRRALARQPGSEKRTIVTISSPCGSGKTQLIKRLVSVNHVDATKRGRVIVRCCSTTAADKDSERSSWLTALLTNHSIDAALCELVRTHVASVTGHPQDPSKYCDPQAAYATWMSETARYFRIQSQEESMDPVIILDTCEFLADRDHTFLVHKFNGKPYSLLEAFCLAIPSPYRILVVGTTVRIDTTDPIMLAITNVFHIGPLPPLSEQGAMNAFRESWQTEISSDVARLLFHWAGGVPRLLRHIAHANHLEFLHRAEQDARSTGHITSRFSFVWLSQRLASSLHLQHPHLADDDAMFAIAYSCLLASSTKAKVKCSDRIAVNPAWRDRNPHHHARRLTYGEAMVCSIGPQHMLADNKHRDNVWRSFGSYDPCTNRFIVPPITFVDELVTRPDTPILPSQLHPLLNAEFVEKFDNIQLIDHEQVFIKAFLYAVYARYLLAHWEDDTTPWVSLAKVFESAVHCDQVSILDRYEVNLSSGVTMRKQHISQHGAAENAATYFDEGAAFLWCREKEQTGVTFAVPLQLWNDLHVRGGQFICTKKEFAADIAIKNAPVVLLVCQQMSDCLKALATDAAVMMINASAMSSICLH
ncbi:Bodo-specific multi-copy gene family, putative [Bodo saltans]|uniref:Bodo-specific multi-copy gene family, putative n=1 Tax=Bodo saltans TaxID=75058 RepID=A0A0S4JPF2_BODSA|nr:Bodo-specific multi-copy gene family, putative [Bodo saltans]|eukprot:CUG92565.1 Bodo-specific multi-copy gene family, putative [Bodo saltans]